MSWKILCNMRIYPLNGRVRTSKKIYNRFSINSIKLLRFSINI